MKFFTIAAAMSASLLVADVGHALTFDGTDTVTTSNIPFGPATFEAQGFGWSGEQDGYECADRPLRHNIGGDGNYHHLNCRLSEFSRIDGKAFDLRSVTLATRDLLRIQTYDQSKIDDLRSVASYYAVADEGYLRATGQGDFVDRAQAYIAAEEVAPLAGGERFALRGYRDGALVAEDRFASQDGDFTRAVAGFDNIDAFAITLDMGDVTPMWNHYWRDFGYSFLDEGELFCEDFICLEAEIKSFEFDEATAAINEIKPVPLPGGVWLMAFALVGLVGIGRRQARA